MLYVNHKGIIFAGRGSFNHSYTLMEGYDIINLQWVAFLTIQRAISLAAMVPNHIDYFA